MKKKVTKIIEIFDILYPAAICTLDFNTPLELLLATQLAAQCTDERVNIVTKNLFKKYRNAEDFAAASLEQLEEDVRSTGFYHNKAKNIKATCMLLLKDFGGQVPGKMEDLLRFPGVGRKTANVVLGSVFNIPGIVVDTHAGRLSRRIGLTKEEDPGRVERDLMKIIPKKNWSKFCHQLVYHGRRTCNARKPKCEICEIRDFCDYANVI